MTSHVRGADIVAATLARLGANTVFTLSGNHIMSIFDAAIDAKLRLVHTRHEAAAVHMADAWGRLSGVPGVALVTGGPGHANAVGALYTALCAESPMVLLSGHAATWEVGRGGFQEIRQADMAAPVTKASWTARSFAMLGEDLVEAFRIAMSGRPGPVHLSLPSDILDAKGAPYQADVPAIGAAGLVQPLTLSERAIDTLLAEIASARTPLIIAGPQFSSEAGRRLLARVEAAVASPAVVVDSPRGINDATLGAFGEVCKDADLVVLLGKALDFTTRWVSAPNFRSDVRLIAIEPDGTLVSRVAREKGAGFVLGLIGDAIPAAEGMATRTEMSGHQRDDAWVKHARALIDSRPAGWSALASVTAGRLHAAEVFRALRPIIERDPRTVLICDGGEFSQWGQSLLPARRRLTNGVAGAIGGSLAFAVAARLAEPKAPVFAVLGDGSFGFHMAEFETAARLGLPFVAILGNDACWNAESQIQRRDYGTNRMHGCDMTPVRYDQVATALGAHGEHVTQLADLIPAVARALASGKPACVNIDVESIAAPVIRSGR
jgi:acetolactate synthase-1/2/3 large subunit